MLAMSVVRPLRPADLAEVLRIQAACYTQIVPESPRSLGAKAAASPATCFVADAGAGRLHAYLIAVPVRYPELPALGAETFDVAAGADVLYLHDLAVAPEGRGTGVADRLVHAVLEAGRQRGWPRACLVAIQQSAGFWQRFGFAPAEPPSAALAAKLASYGEGAQLMVRSG